MLLCIEIQVRYSNKGFVYIYTFSIVNNDISKHIIVDFKKRYILIK